MAAPPPIPGFLVTAARPRTQRAVYSGLLPVTPAERATRNLHPNWRPPTNTRFSAAINPNTGNPFLTDFDNAIQAIDDLCAMEISPTILDHPQLKIGLLPYVYAMECGGVAYILQSALFGYKGSPKYASIDGYIKHVTDYGTAADDIFFRTHALPFFSYVYNFVIPSHKANMLERDVFQKSVVNWLGQMKKGGVKGRCDKEVWSNEWMATHPLTGRDLGTVTKGHFYDYVLLLDRLVPNFSVKVTTWKYNCERKHNLCIHQDLRVMFEAIRGQRLWKERRGTTA